MPVNMPFPSRHLLVTILWISCSIYATKADDPKTLKFVHVLWRHGDRSPSETFPKDVGNPESSWPQGFGELSEMGMQQHYELGQYLKKRYSVDNQLLSENYNVSQIYIVSTSYNRTLMSAMSNLAGMFPPKRSTINSSNLFDRWQPIPVHSRPREEDPMLWMDMPCPTFDDYFKNELMKSDPVTKIMDENKNFFAYLRDVSGHPIPTFRQISKIFDPLFCEKIHNHSWPSWMNETLMERITKLYDLSTSFYYPTRPDTPHRLRGGLLLGDIMDRMNWIASSTTEQALKYYVYSAHDTTLIGLLEAFGAYPYNGYAPPYASSIFVELHLVGGNYIVKAFYRNETNRDPEELLIKDCPPPCSLTRFTERSRPMVPTDWYAECGLKQTPTDNMLVWKIALFVTVGLLALALILSAVLLLKYTRQDKPYGFSRISTEET